MTENKPKFPALLIKFGYIWSFSFVPLALFLNMDNPIGRAIIGMALGLVIIWTVIIGYPINRYKEDIRGWFDRRRIKYPGIVFVVFATLLAMLEELVATSMTNLAEPVFGVSPDDAFITASTNYWEVISRHSVIVFIPYFITWAIILRKYKFDPYWVYVLFGITGTIAETISFGILNLINVGFWTNIYGLMVFLPAYTYPNADKKKPPRWMYPAAVVLSFIGLLIAFIIVSVVIIILGLE